MDSMDVSSFSSLTSFRVSCMVSPFPFPPFDEEEVCPISLKPLSSILSCVIGEDGSFYDAPSLHTWLSSRPFPSYPYVVPGVPIRRLYFFRWGAYAILRPACAILSSATRLLPLLPKRECDPPSKTNSFRVFVSKRVFIPSPLRRGSLVVSKRSAFKRVARAEKKFYVDLREERWVARSASTRKRIPP